jgi:hypothetical protein
MNTIVINVNGTILNLTVKRGSTVSVSFAEVAEEQLVAEEVGEEQVAEEENQNSLISFQEQAPEENEISVISFQEQAPEENEISVISFHEEPEISDTDSAYNYIELCKPAKVHSYERDHAGNYICPYCNILKKKCNTMSEHVRQKHSSEYGRKTDMYVCKYENCNMSFAVRPGLVQHIANRHSEKYIKCPSPNCEHDGARNDSAIVSHYVRNHMDYKNMSTKEKNGMSTCNNCGVSCKTTSMTYHLGRCYAGSPFYKK